MAIKLENKTNVSAPDATYPYGNIKDNTGGNNGTPLNAIVHADFHQFFAKLLGEWEALGGVPNGLPENSVNGFQYFTALQSAATQLINALNPNRLIKKVIDLGDWNMVASGNPAVAVVHGVDPQKVRSVFVIIRGDTGTATYPLNSISATGVSNGAVGSINATTLTIFRTPGEFFDSGSFDSTSFNRGWVTIEYEE